jgi:hypothetical protein
MASRFFATVIAMFWGMSGDASSGYLLTAADEDYCVQYSLYAMFVRNEREGNLGYSIFVRVLTIRVRSSPY